MTRLVGVKIDGVTETHLPSPSVEYATLCGLDGGFEGYDDLTTQKPAKPGKKVDCDMCWQIFKLCAQYSVKDFRGHYGIS